MMTAILRFTSMTVALALLCWSNVQAQVNLTVRINSGSSTTTCTDGFFGGAPEPHWRVEVAGQGYTTYPRRGLCFTNTPNTQYNETFNCASNYPANLQVCLRALEDDGAACILNEDCLEQICQNFATPAPGNSITYTLSVTGSSTANINFTITATGTFVPTGGNYNTICSAVNLGTLNPSSTIGNSALGIYDNYCADNIGDPNPWGGNNDQGVWFQFTTSANPAAVIDFEARSDPQNFGDDIDLQLALYESSNGTCSGTLSLLGDSYQGLGLFNDEDLSIQCLQPNTTYFLLVDGERTNIVNNGGQEGYFGLQIVDAGIQQAADFICDAEFLGLVPPGGAVATPNLGRSNVCATNINDPNPGAWTADKSVWFRFQAPPTGHVIINADSDLPFPLGVDAVDLQLAVYGTSTSTCTGTLNFIASDYTPGLFGESIDVRCLTPGENYWILVDGSPLNVDGIFDITVTDGGIPPAPNDLICDAIPLGNPGNGGTVGLTNQNNYCADNIFEPIPANWGNDQGVWYTFIAPPSGKIEVRLDNGPIIGSDNIDLQVAVYDLAGATCNGSPTELASEHKGIGVLWDEDMEVECLIPGREYWILVDGEGSLIDPDLQEGIFDIEVYGDPRDPASPYDQPCNALALGDPTSGPVGTTAITNHGSQNNFCATAAGEPQPSGFTADQTVWYTFVAPSTGNVNIDLTSDNVLGGVDPINLQIAVWKTPGCTGPWREEVSGDDLIYDVDLDVYCLTPGETYYIQVDGSPPAILGGEEGYFDITISEIPSIPIAPNDSICNAIALGNPFAGTVGITSQHNLCADAQGDPTPSAFSPEQTVWYTFTTPNGLGPYAVDINATSSLPWPLGNRDAIDLQLAVFSSSNNSCTGSLTEVESGYSLLDLFNESLNVPCLEPNRTYFIMVDGSLLDRQGYFDISVSAATPVPLPTNDLICQHENLGTVPIGGSINNGINYYNFCSDTEPGEPNPFAIEQTVWFSFVAPNHLGGPQTTAGVTVSVESDPAGVGNSVDLQLAVYESSNNTCTGTMTLLKNGSSDPAFSFDADVSVTCLEPGRRYWVQVDGSILNQEGYFQIRVRDDGAGYRPPYNIICQAEPLGTVPNGGSINNGTYYTNLCSDTEPGEPNPNAFNVDQTVWFTFRAPTSGNVTINALSDPRNIGDDIDLQLALYYSVNNTCSGPFLEVDSDYDGFNNDESLTVDCLEGGRLYFLQVDGANGLFGNEDGWFTLEVRDDGGTSNFPYNNNICDAYNFGTPSAQQNRNSESNVCANVELGEPGAGGYATHTVWYQFTAPPSGRVEIDVTSTNLFLGIDPEVRVFASSNNACTGNLNEVERSNLPTALITENIEATCLIPGNTYFIQVDGSGLVIEGTFNISIEAIFPNYGTGLAGDPEPTNNACDSAIQLTVQPESCLNGNGTFSQFNYGYPTITYNPAYAQGCGGNCGDTWYQFTMPASGNAIVEGNDDNIGGGLLGDFSDLTVVAYTGNCGNLTPIDCDQGGLTDNVSFQVSAAPGTTIWLQVFNDDGDDDGEEYQLCISEGCGFDDCIDALAIPMIPNVPYCFHTAGANGENISGGAPGYFECSEGDNPEHSIYYYFVSDCNGSDVTLHVINGQSNGNCVLGITPTDGFNISLFQDATPCDNNPDTLVDCQTFTSCDVQPINWNQTYTGLAPNTPYLIQIDGGFGALGGNNIGEIMITTITDPVVTPISTPVTCSGTNDGTASAVTQGGVGPFTFLWSNNSTDSTAINLAPGLYSVTVTGSNGCFDTASVVVDPGVQLTASIVNSTPEQCYNACDGQATVFAIGGNPLSGYNYQWDAATGNQTTATATGLCAGTYSVTVSDAGGCFDTAQVTLLAPDSIVLVLDSMRTVSCNGICDGYAAVSATGGTPPLVYQWSTINTNPQQNNLCAGAYTVTVTDARGCFDTLNINLTQPSGVQLTLIAQTDIRCTGDSTGVLSVIASNGIPTYQYDLYHSTNALLQSNNSGNFTNLPTGSYGVLVTDNGGCTDTLVATITTPTALQLNLISSADATCAGALDASLIVQAAAGSGTAPYVYSLDGINFGPSGRFSGLAANTYFITVRDSLGCTAIQSVVLNEPAAITLTTTTPTVASCGACDGSATTTASGGAGSFSYQWSSGETTATATALCAGTNSVTVTDANGCTATSLVRVNNSNSFAVTPNIDQLISCFGQCDGAISITPPVGLPNISYNWSNSATTSSLSGLCEGTYTVTVTDASGCFVVETIVLAEPDSLALLAASLQGISCLGATDGQATATPTGGTVPHTFTWDNGELTATATTLSAGVHRVTTTDANGCQAVASTIISAPPPLTLNISNTTASNCSSSGCDGSATVLVSGGTPPYTYAWNNGNTTAAPADLCPNFNTVTVTDANGCSDTASVLIPANSNLSLTLTNTILPSCFGACDGSLGVHASGGNTSAPYQYSWSNNQTTATATGLCATTYRITVTDIDGCSAAGAFTLTQPDSLSIQLTTTDASCPGNSDGNISSTTLGGSLPYYYQWNTGDTTAQLSNIEAGTYRVTLTDANGCRATVSTTVNDADTIRISATIPTPYNGQQISCANGNDGSATLTVTGGIGPYTYQWINGQTTATVTQLQASTYPVTVTDVNGCVVVDSVTLMHPPQIVITPHPLTNYNGYNIRCFDGSDGIVVANATGGTGALTYRWSDGQTTDTAVGVNRGRYAVTVTDANGCFTVVTDSLSAPLALQSGTAILQTIACFGDSTGQASVSTTGGVGPYTYLWSNGDATAITNGLPSGFHTVSITDANGCVDTATVGIIQPSELYLTTTSSALDCANDSSGRVSVAAFDGTAPYSYVWSNGQTATTLNNLANGTYGVTVTDANGCVHMDSATVVAPPPLVATANILQNALCNGSATGIATASSTGGVAPYSYVWSSGAFSATATSLAAGVYTVTVLDVNKCQATASVTISTPSSVIVSAQVDTLYHGQVIRCTGAQDGQATANASGGTGPYTYQWSSGDTTATATGLDATTYGVIATDLNGCSDTAQVTLNEPTPVVVTAGTVGAISCAGSSDGSALASASGGTGPYTYQWSTGATGALDTTLRVGTHAITATDVNGCTAVTTVNLPEPNPIVLRLSATNTNCVGSSTGTATVFAQGGVGGYQYRWSSGQTTPVATGLTTATYMVTVTDANGCSMADSISIGGPVPLALIFSDVVDIDCTVNPTGSATATATGGNGPYQYLWNGQTLGATANNLLYGWNVVQVSDARGCTLEDSIFINQPNPMALTTTSTDVGCFGAADGSANVDVSGGTAPYTYTWSNSSLNTDNRTGLSAGNYSVTVTDSIGCLAVATFTLQQSSPIITQFTEVVATDCNNGTTGSLTAAAQGGTPLYTFQWSTGNQQTDSTASRLDHLTAGRYGVTITDANGCSTTLDTILMDPAQLSAIATGSTLQCYGDQNGTITVAVNGGTSPYFYSLNGATPQAGNTFSNLRAGTYNVDVTDANGCLFSTQTQLIQADSVVLQVPNDQSILFGETVPLYVRLLINAPTNPVITWTPSASLNCDSCFQLTAQPSNSTLYTVSVTGDEGCISTADVYIEVDEDRGVFVPNAFSPNGDRTNDVFMLYSSGSVESIETFMVYDRWGELVCHHKNGRPNYPAFGWDGTFRGQPLMPGVFVYYIKVRYFDGTTEILKGDVTLIR